MPRCVACRSPAPKGPFELVERDIPAPRAGTVRIKVQACGICHSDAFTKEGTSRPPVSPRPGHEIAGVIDALGAGVAGWTEGRRVGVGWHGGHCGYCDSCRRGDSSPAASRRQVPHHVRGGTRLRGRSAERWR